MNHSSMQAVPALAAVRLHDMTLVRLILDWDAGHCTAEINGAVVPETSGVRLRWTGVTGVEIPREYPWGPSESINGAKGPIDGRYEIEMQSGDTIFVRATACTIQFDSPAV